MKIITILIVVLTLSAYSDPLTNPTLTPVHVEATPPGEPIVLVNEGKPTATIVIANNDSSRKAAQEFADYVKQATGATLPISTDNQFPITGNLVLIGESSLTKALKITGDGVAKEGFRVQTFSNGLAIIDVGRGAEWGEDGKFQPFGEYDLLERFLGVRWFYPGADGTVVPTQKNFVIPPVSYIDQPVFRKRSMYPMDAPGFSHDDGMTLASHWRLGGTEPMMQCSAFGFLAHYYDQYPEIFQVDGNGNRNKLMPCMGNPKTLELTLKDLEGLWDRNETMPFETATGNKQPYNDHRAIHFQPWDEPVQCQCPECTRIRNSHPAASCGDASEVVGQFAAKLAREIQKRWPDKKFYYQPYFNYTAPPMDVEFPSNVWVQVCTMYGSATAKEPGVDAIQDSWINGWVKLSGHPVQLWEYQLWPVLKMPFQYPHVLQKFYQRHRDHVTGSFLNGVDGPSGVPGEQYAQFGPTMYVWFKLLWNPELNVDAAIAEYVDLLYGPAKAPMRAIVKQLTDRWEKVKWDDGWRLNESSYEKVSPEDIYEQTMPPFEIAKLKANIAQARKLAPKGSVYERRVALFGGAIDPFLAEAAAYNKAHANDGPHLPTIKQINGADRVPGKFGNAYQFNSVSLLSVGRNGFSDQAGTFECWVLGGSNSPMHGELFMASQVGGKSGHCIRNEKSEWSYATWVGPTTNRITFASRLGDGWHHLMATWKAASGEMALYIDGKSCGKTSYVKTSAAKMPIVLGGEAPYALVQGGFAPWSWGGLDEIRLSTIVRKPTPIPTTPFTPDTNTTLLLHFDEEGTGAPAPEPLVK